MAHSSARISGEFHQDHHDHQGSFFTSSTSRHTLANDDSESDEEVIVSGMSNSEIKAKISQHRVKLTRLKQEAKDLAHERTFLEKTLELKRGQKTMQDGQVKLSQAELEDKAKEIEMYKREAPRTLSKYNELVRKQKELQETLNRLHQQSEELSTSKTVILDKIQHLNMEDIIERHARGLPDAMAGALRKSAAALVPFFDYLMLAADTNNRLVDHVGAEIDKYTHVNISDSPFMSGILFYCVLLIPLLTFISFVRRVFDSSSKLTVSHYIIFGNLYFVVMCACNVIAALFLHEDPIGVMFRRFERTFVIGNLFLSIYYSWHVAMLGFQALYTLERRNVSQFVATLSVGIHYFLFAWRRVFTDNAPLMYTFNYLVYGTIFSFILYERFNRLSSKQLNENAIFKVIQLVLKRKRQLATSRGIRNALAEFWAFLTANQDNRDRRFSKKQDRFLLTERHNGRAESREKVRTKPRYSYSSEEDQTQTQYQIEEDSCRRKRARDKANRSGRQRERWGFIRMFFGGQEYDSDSSEEDCEEQGRGTWNLLGGGGGAGRAVGSSIAEPANARSGHAARTTRARDRKTPKPSRTSLWKWS